MMPQPQAETNAVSKVAGQGGCSRGEEGIHAFARGPWSPAKGCLGIRAGCNQVTKLKVTFLGNTVSLLHLSTDLNVSVVGRSSMDVSPNQLFDSKIQKLERIGLRVLLLYSLGVLFHFRCIILAKLQGKYWIAVYTIPAAETSTGSRFHISLTFSAIQCNIW